MRRILVTVILLLCAHPASGRAANDVDLSGLWAHRVVTTSISKIPVLGKLENQSRFYALVSMTQANGTLQMRPKPCWVRIVGGMKRVQTIVPERAIAVMGPRLRAGTVSGQHVHFPSAVDVLGAKLANEETDPLPTEPEAPTQWDEDGDGKPGITIQIMGPIDGEVYVAQRTWNSLTGTADPSGNRIAGLVDWKTQQVVLDGSNPFLTSSPASVPHSDPKRSHFEMRRVPAGTTCEDVKRKNDRLFGAPI